MNTDILIALIGASTSIAVALISKQKDQSDEGKHKSKTSFITITAVGFAITALLMGAFPSIKIVSTTIAVETPENSGVQDGLPVFQAPRVPKGPKEYDINARCPFGYVPASAWHEVIVSHPSSDLFYTVDPSVSQGKLKVAVRARESGSDGYVYAEVFLMCSRFLN